LYYITSTFYPRTTSSASTSNQASNWLSCTRYLTWRCSIVKTQENVYDGNNSETRMDTFCVTVCIKGAHFVYAWQPFTI
jgi:hypothetical protein